MAILRLVIMVSARRTCGMDLLQAPSVVLQNSWLLKYDHLAQFEFWDANDLQILLDKKYGRAVDWWAFGVLIYQMLLQQSPFRGEDEDEIYDAILADEPLYPIHMPRDSVSILQKLLTREPELRLGSGPTDAQEVMSHAFFRNINWDDIYHKRVPPPFMPTISSATDTSNFDQEFTSVTPVLTPVQSGKTLLIFFSYFQILILLFSSFPSDARRVPWFLVHRGFCLVQTFPLARRSNLDLRQIRASWF
jgi:serine/threonine protein kinase